MSICKSDPLLHPLFFTLLPLCHSCHFFTSSHCCEAALAPSPPYCPALTLFNNKNVLNGAAIRLQAVVCILYIIGVEAY